MSDYRPTIGLEIHAELKTRTKMFCDSKNDPDEKRPNVNICPVCMAHPGTLPVINKEAVKHILKMGIAVHGKLADFTRFDRKNYFYPDIPKGYQISQYQHPLVEGGELVGVPITRIHLEEDTARSMHEKGDNSLIDFNRAGVPLMELVTEPAIHDAEMAVAFAKELQLILRYLGAGDANMEKGEMRIEANVSVSKTKKFGTKVEVKNLNSFKSVERAIAFEVKRQIDVLEGGGKIVQETRGWDDVRQVTFSQRLKEESQDYRYFPDPDLPELRLSRIPELQEESLKKEMPELPNDKRKKYKKWGIKDEDVEVFVQEELLGKFIEDVAEELSHNKEKIKIASNYITSDIVGYYKTLGEKRPTDTLTGRISPKHFSSLVSMIHENKIGSRAAKDILTMMFGSGGNPEDIAKEHNLFQKSDTEELRTVVKEILKNNQKIVADYKSGKKAALQYLIGQGMKVTRGSANPDVLREVFEKELG